MLAAFVDWYMKVSVLQVHRRRPFVLLYDYAQRLDAVHLELGYCDVLVQNGQVDYWLPVSPLLLYQEEVRVETGAPLLLRSRHRYDCTFQ